MLRRRWFPIDVDPVRETGISATDAEKELAVERCAAVADFLTHTFGFPEPVRADAGNSPHLLYRIDLKNDNAIRDLISDCLEAISLSFSDDSVTVDTGNFNASRIWKCYGTVARKGDHTVDRPHRLSRILSIPDNIETVPIERLQALAGTLPPAEGATSAADTAKSGRQSSSGTFNLEDFMSRCGIEASYTGTWGQAEKFLLAACPFNSEHNDKSAVVVRWPDGKLGFRCHHNSCKGLAWKDVRDKFEPDRHKGQAERDREPDGRSQQTGKESAHTEAPTVQDFELFSADALYHAQIPDTRWIVEGLLPEGLACLAGRPKQGKSYLALNIAIAVAMSGKALDAYAIPNPGSVLFLALEDNKARIKRRMHQLMRQFLPWPNNLQFSTISPRLGAGFVDSLRRWLETTANPALVVVDMYTKVAPKRKRGSSSGEYDEIYDDLGPVQKLADEFRVCVLLVMHLNKTVDVEDETSRIMGSTAYAGATVTNLILKRLKNTDAADAILSPSGKDLEDEDDIALVFNGGIWASRGPADTYNASQQRLDILQTLFMVPSGEKATPKYIADALEKSPGSIRRLLQKMREDGHITRSNSNDTYHLTNAGTELMQTRSEDDGRERTLDKFENLPETDTEPDTSSHPDYWDNTAPFC